MGGTGEDLSLDVEHGSVDDEEEENPANDAGFEDIATEVSTGNESEEDVDDLEVAHGLEGAEGDERLRAEQDHCDGLMKDAVDQDSGGELREHQIAAFAGDAGDEPEKGQGGNGSEPLVPGPLVEAEPMAAVESFKPGGRRRLEDPGNGNGCDSRGGEVCDLAGAPVADFFLERLVQCESEHTAKGEAHCSHEGMEGEGKQGEREGLPRLGRENARNGEDNERGGEVARVEVLVGDVEGCARHGEGEHGGEHGHGGPLGKEVGGLGEELGRDAPRGPEKDEEGGKLEEENGPGEREVGEANGLGYGSVKDRRLQLEAEEVSVVREEGGMKVCLDASEVDAVIFHAGVVSHDEEAEHREEQGEDEWTKGALVSQERSSPVARAIEKPRSQKFTRVRALDARNADGAFCVQGR